MKYFQRLCNLFQDFTSFCIVLLSFVQFCFFCSVQLPFLFMWRYFEVLSYWVSLNLFIPHLLIFLFIYFCHSLLNHILLIIQLFSGSINLKSNNQKGAEKDTQALPPLISLFWSKMSQTFSTALADQINPADLELFDSILTKVATNDNKESIKNEIRNENKIVNENDKSIEV